MKEYDEILFKLNKLTEEEIEKINQPHRPLNEMGFGFMEIAEDAPPQLGGDLDFKRTNIMTKRPPQGYSLIGTFQEYAAKVAKELQFEINDDMTRDYAKARLIAWLEDAQTNHKIYDYTIAHKFPEQHQCEFQIDVAIQPRDGTEFIYVPIRMQVAESAYKIADLTTIKQPLSVKSKLAKGVKPQTLKYRHI